MSEHTPMDFEREKWRAEYDLHKREVEIKEREQARSRWSNPIVLAVLAAALAGLGNAAATWLNGIEQRKLESERAEQARSMEETKAEAARILEVIKTGDADKAAANLKFLADMGLISDVDRLQHIQTFLGQRSAGGGPALPAGLSASDQATFQMMMTIMQNSLNGIGNPSPPSPASPK
jgi:hypothetical protein